MSGRTVTNLLLLSVLLLGIGVQVTLLSGRMAPDPTATRAGPSFFAQGDTVPVITIKREDGSSGSVTFDGGDRWTALMIFKSTCVWCRQEGPAWAEWMAEPHDFDVVLLADEELEDAQAFASEFAWKLPVQVTDWASNPELRGLMTRTPWMFLVDGSGEIRYHGHGSRLNALDSTLAVATGLR